MTTTPPPGWALAAAGAALARAEIFDDRVTADRERIIAWAEAITPHGIHADDAIKAVTAHYQQAGANTPKPGDIIAAARKIRGDRAEREKIHDLPALTPADPQSGGLPIGGTSGEPIWDAYEQHDAISRPCPTCQAQPDEACVNLATSMTRKIPCHARLKGGTA